MESKIEMLIELIRNSSSILINIPGGIIFAKLVHKNMMKRSRKEIAHGTDQDQGIKTGEKSTTKISITELTNRDIIRPASMESLIFYKNIFKVIKLRFIFTAGCITFPIIFLLTSLVENKYFLIVSCGLFLIFIMGLIVIYIKNVYDIKKISKTLVVLRVFGSRTNTQFLFNQIVSLWNYLGSTFTIMDPVYARSEFTIFNSPKNLKLKIAQIFSFIPGTIFVELHSFNNVFVDFMFVIFSTLIIFMFFLSLIAGSFFIKDTKSLLKKIHRNSNFAKRYNGIGKQINLYCFDNIWKKALKEMLVRADIAVMDLRGFSSERKGCAFEMSYLVNNFELDKVLFLINQKTDRNLVIETLKKESDKINSSSPNAGKENLNVSIYSCEKQNSKDTRQIIRILCNKSAEIIEYSKENTELSYTTPIPLIRIPTILIFIIAGVVLTFTIIFSSYGISYISKMKSSEEMQDIIAAPPPPPFDTFELPAFSTTTVDVEPHFTRVTISLAYEADPIIKSELENRNVQLYHVINILLRGKTYKELDSVEDKINFSEEIKTHINSLLISGKIKEIYFKEFIVN